MHGGPAEAVRLLLVNSSTRGVSSTWPVRNACVSGFTSPCSKEKKPEGCGLTATRRRGAHLPLAPCSESFCEAAMCSRKARVVAAARAIVAGSHAARAAAASSKYSSRLKRVNSASRHASGAAPKGGRVRPSVSPKVLTASAAATICGGVSAVESRLGAGCGGVASTSSGVRS